MDESLKPRGGKRRKLNSQNLPILLILLLGIVVVLLFVLSSHEQEQLNLSGKHYDNTMLSKLSKVMLLPQGSPTIATVKDATKINQLAFYKQAKNGDVVFVYNNQHEAILYRPSSNLIINVATNIQSSSSSTDLLK